MATTTVVVRSLHATPSQHAWFMTPLARILVAVGARVGRKVWKRISNTRRESIKEALGKKSGTILSGIGIGTACCIGYYVYHIEEAPVTKRQRFMMFNRQKLLKMIDVEKEVLITHATLGCPILPASDAAYGQIIPILKRILPVLSNHWVGDSNIKQVKWTLYVLDSPGVANAVCLPSGEIFVHSGLLEVCHNQDELALILSHEVAHVLMNHGGELLSKRGLLDFFQLFVVAALWFCIPSDLVSFFLHNSSHSLVNMLFHLPHSRQLEEEADMVGLMLMSSACFQPDKSVEIWNHFPSTSGETEQLPEYLSTHPVNESRLETLQGLVPLANEVWHASNCHKMQIETTSFKSIVNKTLKGIFSGQ